MPITPSPATQSRRLMFRSVSYNCVSTVSQVIKDIRERELDVDAILLGEHAVHFTEVYVDGCRVGYLEGAPCNAGEGKLEMGLIDPFDLPRPEGEWPGDAAVHAVVRALTLAPQIWPEELSPWELGQDHHISLERGTDFQFDGSDMAAMERRAAAGLERCLMVYLQPEISTAGDLCGVPFDEVLRLAREGGRRSLPLPGALPSGPDSTIYLPWRDRLHFVLETLS